MPLRGRLGEADQENELSTGRRDWTVSLTKDEGLVALMVASGLQCAMKRREQRCGLAVGAKNAHVKFVGWLQYSTRMFSADLTGKFLIWGWGNLQRVRGEEASKEDQRVTAVAYSSDDICISAVRGAGDAFKYDLKTEKVV